MDATSPEFEPAVAGFVAALRADLPDGRDPRGKHHDLAFVLAAVVIAIVCRYQTLSSIHRFMLYRAEWLARVIGIGAGKTVSRAHLPRLLNAVNWDELSALITAHFGLGPTAQGWIAVDGKTLRGSSSYSDRQAVVIAVAHDTAAEVAVAQQAGKKTSEIPVVRKLLKRTRLDQRRVTLDALHCNPTTLGQVNRAGGTYLVQVKENQNALLNDCQVLAMEAVPLAQLAKSDKGHGRVTTWTSRLFKLCPPAMARRQRRAGNRFLVTVHRETWHQKDQSTTSETSYYVSNAAVAPSALAQLADLSGAIRGHWAVEANNWVRDVTLGEDDVHVSAPNQAHVLALLRGLALTLLRKAGATNLLALTERLLHLPSELHALLKSSKFP